MRTMMQAAEDGPRFEGVNWSPRRRILVQGQVGSAPIVVARITPSGGATGMRWYSIRTRIDLRSKESSDNHQHQR